MKLIKDTNPQIIMADEGKKIRSIDDVYIPEHRDEKTGELVPEHIPYYTTIIYCPAKIDLDEQAKLYVEEDE